MSKKFLLNFFIGFCGLFLVINLFKDIISFSKKGDLVRQAEERLAQERLKNDELKKTFSEVQDPDYIEKEAREKLNLGKEGEVVVILPSIPKESEEEKSEQPQIWQQWLNLYR